MVTLSILGAAVLIVGTVNTVRLVSNDGLHRVAPLQRY
jgi:hypothetical protein